MNTKILNTLVKKNVFKLVDFNPMPTNSELFEGVKDPLLNGSNIFLLIFQYI